MRFIETPFQSVNERENALKVDTSYEDIVIPLEDIIDFSPFDDGTQINLVGRQRVFCANRWMVRARPFLPPMRELLGI